MRPTPVVTIASRIGPFVEPGILECQNVALRDPRAMFCEFEGEVEECRVVVGHGGKGMSEQGPAIVAPPDGRHTVKNRVLLIPTQPALANNNCVDELLLGLNGMWYGTLRPKQVGQKSVRCNQLRIGPRWFVGDGRRLTHGQSGLPVYREILPFTPAP